MSAKCPHCHKLLEPKLPDIRIVKGSTLQHGTCSACTSQIDEYGTKEDTVWVVKLRMQEFRFCDRCLKYFKSLM